MHTIYILKALNDLSPVYLKDCIATHVPSREGLRSSRDVTRLSIPKSSRRIGDGSFSVFGPTLWNTLPLTLRSSPNGFCFQTQPQNLFILVYICYYLCVKRINHFWGELRYIRAGFIYVHLNHLDMTYSLTLPHSLPVFDLKIFWNSLIASSLEVNGVFWYWPISPIRPHSVNSKIISLPV